MAPPSSTFAARSSASSRTRSFEDLRLELAPGDTLLLYTDGVTEERHEGELFGDERLIELAESLADPPAEQVARRIVEAVAAFRPGPPADDIAVLALRNA